MEDSAVAARYGRTPAVKRRRLALGVSAAVAVLVVVVSWVVWVGLFTPAATLEARDIGYSAPADDDTVIDIRFAVSTEPGNTVSCALQALNDQFAIVGWRIVDLPPAEVRTRSLVETVRLSEPAVTGLIYRCWLT